MARIEFEPRMIEARSEADRSTDSLLELGLMYSAGRGVERNFIEAHKWLNIAALRGSLAARSYRSEVAEEMTKADIAKAQRLAREWLALH